MIRFHARLRQSVGGGGVVEEFSTLNTFKRTGFIFEGVTSTTLRLYYD